METEKNMSDITWMESLKRAHEMYDAGVGSFLIGIELEKAKDLYEEEKEERAQKAERQKAGKAIFEETGAGIGRLVAEKNVKYGDSFYKSGDVLRLLYPDGIRPNQYDDMLAVTRVLDKIFRIVTDKDAFGENPWKDIAGYSLLKAAESSEKRI